MPEISKVKTLGISGIALQALFTIGFILRIGIK
jgi:hypothetical protein